MGPSVSSKLIQQAYTFQSSLEAGKSMARPTAMFNTLALRLGGSWEQLSPVRDGPRDSLCVVTTSIPLSFLSHMALADV